MRKVIILIILCLLTVSFYNFFITNVSAEENADIPKIYLTGDISEMNDKKDKRKTEFRYENGDKIFGSYAKLRIQGSYSLGFEKKNYLINFYEDDTYMNKKNIDLGWGGYNKYVLKANWVDKTHAKNIVTSNIAADINSRYGLFASTPNYGETDGYPVEVYVNNDFFGLYTLNIPKSDWMFSMEEENSKNILFSSDAWAESNLFMAKIGFDENWDFEIGNDEGYAVAQLNKVMDFVINSSDEEFRKNLNAYFNLDSLLNYYVLVEFAELSDNFGKNILVGTYDGIRWFLALYDLDLSWGASWLGGTLDYQASSGIERNLLFKRLEENFPNELADRYFALRKTILTKENIMSKFRDFESKIPQESLEKDIEKWGEALGLDIDQIEEFLDARIPFTDKLFYDMYTIEPEVYINYDSDKNDSFFEVNLVANREDIFIKDADENYELSRTFYQNGEYVITYQDWLGNFSETTTIEVNNIKDKKEDNRPYITIATFSVILCLAATCIAAHDIIKPRVKTCF